MLSFFYIFKRLHISYSSIIPYEHVLVISNIDLSFKKKPRIFKVINTTKKRRRRNRRFFFFNILQANTLQLSHVSIYIINCLFSLWQIVVVDISSYGLYPEVPRMYRKGKRKSFLIWINNCYE